MKRKLLMLLSIFVVAGGVYYLMLPEKTAETLAVKIVPVEQLAVTDEDRRIWQSFEDDSEEETATDGSSALPDDIRESVEEEDGAPDAKVEDAGWFDGISHKAKEMNASYDEPNESSQAHRDSLKVMPHKKDIFWLRQILDDGEEEDVIMETEPEGESHGGEAILEDSADTVSPMITD